MARPVRRIYAAGAALLSLGVAWAGIAGQGTNTAGGGGTDPRLTALAAREAQVQRSAAHARTVVDRRWAVYRKELRRRKQLAAAPAAAPVVRYVSLPPVTVSRSS